MVAPAAIPCSLSSHFHPLSSIPFQHSLWTSATCMQCMQWAALWVACRWLAICVQIIISPNKAAAEPILLWTVWVIYKMLIGCRVFQSGVNWERKGSKILLDWGVGRPSAPPQRLAQWKKSPVHQYCLLWTQPVCSCLSLFIQKWDIVSLIVFSDILLLTWYKVSPEVLIQVLQVFFTQ